MPNLKGWLRALFDRFTRGKQDSVALAPNSGPRGAVEIQIYMQSIIGDALNVPGESLNPNEPITSYGLDSIAAFTLTLELSEWLERDLPASLLWEFPTIAELAKHLAEEPKS